MRTPVTTAISPESPMPTEPPPTLGIPCAHCVTAWGATPTADLVIHLHDRRVFARGTHLCAACANGCGLATR